MSQQGSHHGHGHDHHHHAGDLLKSTSIGSSGTRIVQLGLISNLALALIKLASGWALRSKSLTADAWHSFGDLIVDCLALFALILSSVLHKTSKSETATARIERMLSMAAAGLLIYTASHVGWESLVALQAHSSAGSLTNDKISTNHTIGQHHHHHHHDPMEEESPSLQAIWPAALTFVVKEWLYRASKFTNPKECLTAHTDGLTLSDESRKGDQVLDFGVERRAPTRRQPC